jgi:pimeloyl-ACP methyl ester carboxylesterase
MTTSSATSCYATLPEAQRSFVADFAASHPQKRREVDGVTWSYFDSGQGSEVLLLLHGGYTDFDMWIHQIVAFEGDYRIIAPTCPVLPEATVQVYVDALRAILSAEAIGRLHVMGYSEGGLIAQCFLREHADAIDKAILAHTFYPSSESTYYSKDFTLFRKLPAAQTEWIFRALAQPDEEELHPDDTQCLAWFKCYFKDLKRRLTKDKILTHIDLMSDFVRNYSFAPEDLAGWDGDMLITVSEDDTVRSYVAGLQRLYSDADVHVFRAGLGAHSVALISPQVFNRRIRAFLEA